MTSALQHVVSSALAPAVPTDRLLQFTERHFDAVVCYQLHHVDQAGTVTVLETYDRTKAGSADGVVDDATEAAIQHCEAAGEAGRYALVAVAEGSLVRAAIPFRLQPSPGAAVEAGLSDPRIHGLQGLVGSLVSAFRLQLAANEKQGRLLQSMLEGSQKILLSQLDRANERLSAMEERYAGWLDVMEKAKSEAVERECKQLETATELELRADLFKTAKEELFPILAGYLTGANDVQTVLKKLRDKGEKEGFDAFELIVGSLDDEGREAFGSLLGVAERKDKAWKRFLTGRDEEGNAGAGSTSPAEDSGSTGLAGSPASATKGAAELVAKVAAKAASTSAPKKTATRKKGARK